MCPQLPPIAYGSSTELQNGRGTSGVVSGGVTTSRVRAPMDCGLGRPIMQNDGTTRHWFLEDHLGSTVGLVDSAGVLTDRWTYSAFGVELSHTGGTVTPWGFAGGQAGDPGRQVKFGGRYHDPSLGRWTQVDPVPGEPLDSYAGDDPVNMVDRNGGWWRNFRRRIGGACQFGAGWYGYSPCSLRRQGWRSLVLVVKAMVSAIGRCAKGIGLSVGRCGLAQIFFRPASNTFTDFEPYGQSPYALGKSWGLVEFGELQTMLVDGASRARGGSLDTRSSIHSPILMRLRRYGINGGRSW